MFSRLFCCTRLVSYQAGVVGFRSQQAFPRGVMLLNTSLYLLLPITAGIIWLMEYNDNDTIIWARAATLIGMALKGYQTKPGPGSMELFAPAGEYSLAAIAISSWRTESPGEVTYGKAGVMNDTSGCYYRSGPRRTILRDHTRF